MSKHFTHLHLHTEFSLLDGAIKLESLIDYGKRNNLKALAITDHGNIFGAVKFFELCKKAKIKPILGMEAYITEDANDKKVDNKYYHIVLIVKNEIGYKNLCKLIAFSFKEGFYFKPRIDYKVLEKHSQGLIILSGCLGSHLSRLLLADENEKADELIDWYLRVFGKENFYLEVQPDEQNDQKKLNLKLFEIAKKRDLELVATGDCHYENLDDRQAHEVMLSINTRAKLDDPKRYTFGDCRVFMRNEQQMLEIFKDYPDAIYNSGKIADQCTFDFVTGVLHFPTFQIPKDHTESSYFRFLCKEGFENLIKKEFILKENIESYQARLDLEMDLIDRMGYIGYLLVVSDFIQWAKKELIPVGPGRGSAAGSLVAWALSITNIDPIKYNLLFERFLNPERISMPDIDIDFCIEGRERVIEYVKNKYGHDKVCQIITFGTMMAKGVLKDVARVLSIPFEDANAITDLIPNQLNITLEESLEQEPRLVEMINNNPNIKQLFEIAKKLEGITRHASKHAAGIVISPEPIEDVLPVYIPAKTDELVTQYAMTELESLGFLKMDFLGLKTLTLIDKVLKMIKKNKNLEIDIEKISLEDKKTFELLCAGKTSGVFQLESDGLKEVLKKLQPCKFEDIIAVNALYRPGPLGSGMVDDFIERRHGRQKVKYLFEEIGPILQETYGVIVYQEQVIKIASVIGGYSLGQADILRRAMGKKKADVMAEQSKIFVTKAIERNFNGKIAQELFDLMAYFAGYGFNKSHSAAYALIAYQTAFLKSNFPCEFMACLISLESTNAEKMSFYLQEAKSMEIKIVAPDINESLIEFSIKNDAIAFGLHGIKNVGLAALENIILQRKKEPFKDILDFCIKVDLRTSNKRVVEHLIYAGAFDQLPGNRAQKISELESIYETAIDYKKSKLTGQMGIFSTSRKNNEFEFYRFQELTDLTNQEKLAKELEVIGFYLSSHPLDIYKKLTKKLVLNSFEYLFEQMKKTNASEINYWSFGLIKNKRIITTKKGDRMAFIQFEDYNSNAEIVVFPKLFKQIENQINDYDVFLIKGTLDQTTVSKCKIIANELIACQLFFKECKTITKCSVTLFESNIQNSINDIKQNIKSGKTELELIFCENDKIIKLNVNKKINIDENLIEKLELNENRINIFLS